MAEPTKRLGDLLREKGLLTEQQINVAIEQQKITGDLLGVIFIKLGFVSSAEVARALSEQAGIPYLNLYEYAVADEALRMVPKEVAEKVGFMPIDYRNGRLTIGIVNSSNVLAIDTATQLTKAAPDVYVIDSDAFYDLIDRAYYFLENPVLKRLQEVISALRNAENVSAGTVSTLAELIIMDAIRRNATDLHITPEKEAVHVFYRIDGVLQHGLCYPKSAQNGVISKIKVMAQLDIAEQRLPQDGSFSFAFLNKTYDMRVSSVPTIYGENIVIRVLSGTNTLARLSSLGFAMEDTRVLDLLFKKPYGIILITGPTGSGKTTTLYAALREINLLEKNVLTVEDPVEYRLSLVKQTTVNQKTGYDFAMAGRNFMRQDPDVMLLGEIRDEETAKIAIRASITGHLVLSTLHTNDSISAIPRLLDLGVDRFLLSTSLLAIISQRLVRKICIHCREPHEVTAEEKRRLLFSGIAQDPPAAFVGKGCKVCNFTGYAGRTVIGEILILDDETREFVSASASIKTIKDAAVRNGMRFLRDDGLRKVVAGVTSIEEILRVVG